MPSEPTPSDPRPSAPLAAAGDSASRRSALGDTARRYLTSAEAPADSTALGRATLSDRVRGAVLALIDEGGYSAGDELPSTGALAERFDVSKTVIREALSALAALGIIEIANGRRATVRPLDSSVVRFFLSRAVRESADDGFTALMDLRSPLEIRAAQVAARRVRVSGAGGTQGAGGTRGSRATRGYRDTRGAEEAGSPADSPAADTAPTADEDEDSAQSLRALLVEMDAALEDSTLYPELDLRLHQEIARLSGNRALHGILEAVSTPLFRAMRDLRATRDQHGLVGDEHSQHVRIVEAILSGDEAEAAAAMAAHMTAVESIGTGDAPEGPLPPRSAPPS